MIRWSSYITRKAWRSDKGEYFRKSLILVLLITSVPSTLIAVSNYLIGTRQIEKQVNQLHKVKIEQFSQAINEQFSQIELAISRWATNPMFGDRLDHLTFLDQISETQDLMQNMLVVGGSNVLIEDAQLYLSRQNAVIGSDGIHYLTAAQSIRYKALLDNSAGILWAYNLPDFASETSEAPVSMIFKLPWASQTPFGSFVLHMNRKEMLTMLEHYLTDGQGAAMLIQPGGGWVIQPEARDEQFQEKLRAEIMQRGHGDGEFALRWQKQDYVVSYGTVSKTGWIYATATPVTNLTEPVLFTSKLLLGTSLTGMLVAIVLAWFASNRLYRPIGRLVALLRSNRADAAGPVHREMEFIENQWTALSRERVSLQERLQQSIPLLREGFLLQFVQGHLYALRETELRGRMEELGMDVQGRMFSILFVQLSGLSDSGRFKDRDKQLVTFAAANIIGEVAEDREPEFHTINFQELSVGLLGLFPAGQPMEAIRNSLFELSGELMTSLSRILGLNVTVVIGRLTEQAGDVPAVLEQARQAARFRDMQMSLQVIDMEDVIPVARSTAQYPFAAEKELLQMMRLGLEQEAYAQLDCFVDEVEGSADWEMTVRQSLFQLVYGIRYMFIESGFHHHPLLAGGDLLEDMLSVQETAALKKWVRSHIIVPYMQQFQELQNGRTRRQVEQVIRLMNDRYGEDLSLDECAKETAANPFALSRSFKQVTGLNFVDYLTRVRIDKAKELLLTTGMKVNEIAERVGYQHSYFNKIFKGSESITPTQFRDKYKK